MFDNIMISAIIINISYHNRKYDFKSALFFDLGFVVSSYFLMYYYGMNDFLFDIETNICLVLGGYSHGLSHKKTKEVLTSF